MEVGGLLGRVALDANIGIFANMGLGERADFGRLIPLPATKKRRHPRERAYAVKVKPSRPWKPRLLRILDDEIDGLPFNYFESLGPVGYAACKAAR